MPPSKEVSAVEIIAKAVDILGPRGEHWITGSEADDDGNFCMIGALHKAAEQVGAHRNSSQRAEAFDAVAKALPKPLAEAYECEVKSAGSYSSRVDTAEDHIPEFNDSQKRFAPVKRVMCKALKAAAAAEAAAAKKKEVPNARAKRSRSHKQSNRTARQGR